ncbi:MAG TPA: STAS/SEC14 domain-containing protein [Polyangiales bacterium]|nr:STAS/SEC14 domain-containing protein [Polyangiales bacterium]
MLARRQGALYIAVISDSTAVRFLASAVALIVRRLRTFPSGELESALAYLQLTPAEAQTVRGIAHERAHQANANTLSSTSPSNGVDT